MLFAQGAGCGTGLPWCGETALGPCKGVAPPIKYSASKQPVDWAATPDGFGCQSFFGNRETGGRQRLSGLLSPKKRLWVGGNSSFQWHLSSAGIPARLRWRQ